MVKKQEKFKTGKEKVGNVGKNKRCVHKVKRCRRQKEGSQRRWSCFTLQ